MRFALLVVALAGCYAPEPRAGAQCGGQGECPAPLACRASTNTCELSGSGGGGDAAPAKDAAIDGAVDARLDAAIDAPVPPPPAATLRQQIANDNASGGTIAASLPNKPVNGHLLVMVGGNPSGALDSVTGGGVATWMLAARSTVNVNVEIWYGVTDGSSADISFTRTTGDAPNTIWVGEFTRATGALDVANALDGTTSPASASFVATTTASDLIIFAVADGQPNAFGATPAPGAWTAANLVTGIGTTEQVWFANVDTIGTYGPTVSETSHHWDAAIAAFAR